jgi:lysophospholipase L1-like esterase
MRFKALVFAACLAVGSASGALAQTPVPNPPPHFNAIKIVLVGDSTTAVQGGWGPSFCAKHVTSFAACINLARGGRSSGNYRTEGSWALAMHEIRSGGFNDTYVLVQFGHNDQPGKPGRSTDLAAEFPANLKAYVADIRAAGGKPVLVTPLTRRQFKEGQLVDDLAPWAEAVRKVAAETGTPLVDLHADSHAAVQAMGAAEATRFAQRPPAPHVLEAARTGTTIAADTPAPGTVATPVAAAPAPQNNAAVEPMGQAKLSFDYTHLGETGADYFATMVTADLAKAVPALRRFLIP